jgi:hypothetical protein
MSPDDMLRLLLGWVFILLICVPGTQAGKVGEGRFAVERYYRAEDATAAANVLLEDAIARGLDVDHRGNVVTPYPVKVPSGSFMPDAEGWADKLASQCRPDTVVLAIIELSRSISIRELAGLMALDVSIQQELIGSYIAFVNTINIEALAELEYVRWAGQYEPQYKVEGDASTVEPGCAVSVFSLRPVDTALQQELRNLGFRVRGTMPDYDYLAIDVENEADVRRLASLWWVWKIAIPRPLQTQGGG